MSVSTGVSDSTVTLISYDDIQFQWAKKDLNKGKISPVQSDTTFVLMTYQEGANWNVGDTLTVHTSGGDKTVTIARVVTTTNAVNSTGSFGYMICSESTFTEIAGNSGYTTIDVQFSKARDDATVAAIRNLLPEDSSVSDKRLTNSEAQSSYYTGTVFIYGFLIIIALITIFNIFKSMNASVASQTKQYGIMHSIGMGTEQLYKMIAAEALTYALLGCVTGCVLGLPLNKMMFQFLIADKLGTDWSVPVRLLLLIVLLCLASAAISIRRPTNRSAK